MWEVSQQNTINLLHLGRVEIDSCFPEIKRESKFSIKKIYILRFYCKEKRVLI